MNTASTGADADDGTCVLRGWRLQGSATTTPGRTPRSRTATGPIAIVTTASRVRREGHWPIAPSPSAPWFQNGSSGRQRGPNAFPVRARSHSTRATAATAAGRTNDGCGRKAVCAADARAAANDQHTGRAGRRGPHIRRGRRRPSSRRLRGVRARAREPGHTDSTSTRHNTNRLKSGSLQTLVAMYRAAAPAPRSRPPTSATSSIAAVATPARRRR